MSRIYATVILALVLATAAHGVAKPPAIAVGAQEAPYLNDDCSYIEGWIAAYEVCVDRFPQQDPDRVAPYSWTVGEDCKISDIQCYSVSCGEASRPEGLTTVNGTVVYAPGTAENPHPLKDELARELGEQLNQGVEDARKWREGWTEWIKSWFVSSGSDDDDEEDDGQDDGEEGDTAPEGDGFVPGDGGCFPFPI